MPIPSYTRIRPDVIDSLKRYVDQRIPPGSFLQAVLENDLMMAFGRADEDNSSNLFHICSYVYSQLPSRCHGSPETVKQWLSERKEVA